LIETLSSFLCVTRYVLRVMRGYHQPFASNPALAASTSASCLDEPWPVATSSSETYKPISKILA
jgi:hypothetical protein